MGGGDRRPSWEGAPRPRALAGAPGVCVARCVLGLTVYTRHRPPAPSAGVGALLRAFLEVAPVEALTLFRTSLLDAWRRLEDGDLAAIVRLVANDEGGGAARHLFSFHLADGPHAPEVFFHYREVDEGRGVGAGYVQLGLPLDTAPEHLFQLALQASHATPLWCGAAGFAVSAHPVEVDTSLSAAWAWCKRHHGLDVQDPERARHHASRGLPCFNWLTLVDDALAEAAGFAAPPPDPAAVALDVQWLRTPRGVVVRAGAAPTLGDVNGLRPCEAYGCAAAQLAPLLPAPLPRWGGRFWEGEQSERWHRRFAEPEGWSS